MALVQKSVQSNSWLVDITAQDDFLGLRDQSSCKHVSNFGWLWSYGHLKLRIEGKDYWKQMELNNNKV